MNDFEWELQKWGERSHESIMKANKAEQMGLQPSEYASDEDTFQAIHLPTDVFNSDIYYGDMMRMPSYKFSPEGFEQLSVQPTNTGIVQNPLDKEDSYPIFGYRGGMHFSRLNSGDVKGSNGYIDTRREEFMTGEDIGRAKGLESSLRDDGWVDDVYGFYVNFPSKKNYKIRDINSYIDMLKKFGTVVSGYTVPDIDKMKEAGYLSWEFPASYFASLNKDVYKRLVNDKIAIPGRLYDEPQVIMFAYDGSPMISYPYHKSNLIKEGLNLGQFSTRDMYRIHNMTRDKYREKRRAYEQRMLENAYYEQLFADEDI